MTAAVEQTRARTQSFLVREPRPTDQGYIASTWARSMTHNSRRWTRRNHAALSVDRVLDHASTAVLVACKDGEPDRIVGWLCWAKVDAARVVHYCYVRDSWRREGVMSALLKAAKLDDDRPMLITHKGPSTHWAAAKFQATHKPIQELL